MGAAPIFLTGFMGAGKSKIGRLLARRLGREFIDTDQMIEARAGKEIAAIFAEDGEARFRQLERECVLEACGRQGAVVALGGGAIAQEPNLAAVRHSGVLVWLRADVDTILARVSRRDDRPLLAGLGPEEKRARIEQMLAARAPYYEQAHIEVHSSEERTPEQTADELIEVLEHWIAENNR